MQNRKIDEMMWMALTDAAFRDALLKDRRGWVLETIGFSDDERQALLSVQADSLEAFAGALCQARG